jgi:hypothetical protein
LNKETASQLAAGTPIATFVDGKYPQSPLDSRRAHGAYISRYDAVTQTLYVIDQWQGTSGPRVVQERELHFRGSEYTGYRSNNGDEFSVVLWRE